MTWYWLAWKLSLEFDGRASRKAFWMFFLINFCIGGIFIFGEIVLKIHWAFDVVYTVASLLPTLTVSIRRLHDTNRSGWGMLLIFLPAIGIIILLMMLAKASDKKTNIYGAPTEKDLNK